MPVALPSSPRVNRISLGVQSFDPNALAWMGRQHGPEGAVRAVATARQSGLDNLSLDLIFGLPDRLGRNWSQDLARILDLDPPHISLYGLTVEASTPLGRAVAEERESVADEGRYRAQYLEAVETLTEAGYGHYEVSNFARPGYESRHNLAYWTGEPYLGLGNGAHSYAHPVRRWNIRDWHTYRQAALRPDPPVAESERLSPEAARLEQVWLGLRIRQGVEDRRLTDAGRSVTKRWKQKGLARDEGGWTRLTATGWLVLDRLAVELTEVEGPAASAGPGD